MKKFFFILTAYLFGCGGGGGGGSSANSVQTLCSKSKTQGTWRGTISGQSDTMTIDSDCKATSTYCGSQSEILFYTSEYPCSNSSYLSCGTYRVTVISGNNNSGCISSSSHADCDFSVDSNGQTLRYQCGAGTFIYTK